ncbi:hypothetical protein KGQ25_03060 [Patescibacteria group bacterium]|nr:hypothetical protein [Patescibacteria group bacterium]
MPLKKRIIGIDFDDVLADFNTSLAKFHNEIYGTSYRRDDIVVYELGHTWGCSGEEAARRVSEFYHSAHHDRIAPVKGAVRVLSQLKRKNVFVIITSRPEGVRGRTFSLINKYFPRMFKEVHFLGHYHGTEARRETKGDMCKKLGVEVFIDDSLEHAASVSREGIKVLLFNTPWNRHKKPAHVVRVFGWGDVLKKLRAL